MTGPDWLGWVVRLQGIAQAGLELSDGPYDLERYRALPPSRSQATATL